MTRIKIVVPPENAERVRKFFDDLRKRKEERMKEIWERNAPLIEELKKQLKEKS